MKQFTITIIIIIIVYYTIGTRQQTIHNTQSCSIAD